MQQLAGLPASWPIMSSLVFPNLASLSPTCFPSHCPSSSPAFASAPPPPSVPTLCLAKLLGLLRAQLHLQQHFLIIPVHTDHSLLCSSFGQHTFECLLMPGTVLGAGDTEVSCMGLERTTALGPWPLPIVTGANQHHPESPSFVPQHCCPPPSMRHSLQ